jgi:sporulation protein YlmC with PRC-barrel domain
MMRSIRQLYGKKLGASDGDLGHVKDFYFNDQEWIVRYVVADTGSWLTGRSVLLSPHAFGSLHEEGDCLVVNLTRQQIEDSPSILSHVPVSRQYEEEYYRYYAWPSYWEADGTFGIGNFPGSALPASDLDEEVGPKSKDADPHLRSTHALKGYEVQTSEGGLGHVVDFMMEEESWTIRQLVIETGHWFSGKQIVISPNHVDRISYEESKIFVNLTKKAIMDAPEYHVPQLGESYHDSQGFEENS